MKLLASLDRRDRRLLGNHRGARPLHDRSAGAGASSGAGRLRHSFHVFNCTAWSQGRLLGARGAGVPDRSLRRARLHPSLILQTRTLSSSWRSRRVSRTSRRSRRSDASLAHGGRVLADGFVCRWPFCRTAISTRSRRLNSLEVFCEAEPNGFSSIAEGGSLVMREVRAGWKRDVPRQQAVYTCGDEGVVITYPVDKSTVGLVGQRDAA